MEMRVIAILNHKGGVGKTATASNLGAALNEAGKRVLLIDADPQASLTNSLLSGAVDEERTLYALLSDKRGNGTAQPYQVKPALDIIPGGHALATLIGIRDNNADKDAAQIIPAKLRHDLGRFSEAYDYALIDCPPSLGILTLNALIAADDAIITTTAEALPYAGLTDIFDIVEVAQSFAREDLRVSGILITRYNGRNLNKVVEDKLRTRYGAIVFKTKIRENIAIAEAPLYKQPITDYAPNSNGAKDYRALAKEILG